MHQDIEDVAEFENELIDLQSKKIIERLEKKERALIIHSKARLLCLFSQYNQFELFNKYKNYGSKFIRK